MLYLKSNNLSIDAQEYDLFAEAYAHNPNAILINRKASIDQKNFQNFDFQAHDQEENRRIRQMLAERANERAKKPSLQLVENEFFRD